MPADKTTPTSRQLPNSQITPPPSSKLGDCVLRFTADTADLDKCVSETVERLERALAAFKLEWNRK